MNEYKFQRRRKKRGDYCLVSYTPADGTYQHRRHGLCGCGGRSAPTKEQKKRLIRRAIARLDAKEIFDISKG